MHREEFFEWPSARGFAPGLAGISKHEIRPSDGDLGPVDGARDVERFCWPRAWFWPSSDE